MSGGAFLLSFTLVLQAHLAPIPRLPIFAVWNFSRSLSLSPMLVCCRLEICNIVPGDCVCRGQHHCSWRLSCCPLEVRRRHVPDLAVSHHLDHLCLSLHLWSHDSFPRNLGYLEKLFFIIFPLGTFFRLLFSLKSHAPCATERQCLPEGEPVRILGKQRRLKDLVKKHSERKPSRQLRSRNSESPEDRDDHTGQRSRTLRRILSA